MRFTDTGEWFSIAAGKPAFQLFLPEPSAAGAAVAAAGAVLVPRRRA